MSLRNSGNLRKLEPDERIGLAQELFGELENEDSFRQEGLRCYNFLNGVQWEESELKTLKARKQPAMVFNLIKPVVNSIESLQKGNRSEIAYKPEDSSGHDFIASKVITTVSKHDLRRIKFEVTESDAFRDYLVTGRGATQAFYNDNKEMIGMEKIDFRNLYIDKSSRKDDLTDCSHLHIAEYISEAEVNVMFADEANLIGGESSMVNEDNAMVAGSHSDRVRVVYTWAKIPVKDTVGYHFEYDCLVWKDGVHLAYYENPYPQLKNYPISIMTLYRDLDNLPYGMVRGMIDAQRSYNHSRSKISHILNTRKYVYREGAFDGSDVELANKLSQVDAVIGLENGADDIQDVTQYYDIQHLWTMAKESKDVIREIAGLSEELQGSGSGSLSGKAIKLRQDSGIMRLTEVFDGLAQWKTEVGKAVMGIIIGNYTNARVSRILIAGGKEEFEDKEQREKAVKLWSALNVDGLEEYDIVHDTDAVSISQQEQEYQDLLQVYSMNPEAIPLSAIIQASSMINKDKTLAIMDEHDQLKQGYAQAQQQLEQAQQQSQAVAEQHESVVQELMAKNEKLENSIVKIMQKTGAM